MTFIRNGNYPKIKNPCSNPPVLRRNIHSSRSVIDWLWDKNFDSVIKFISTPYVTTLKLFIELQFPEKKKSPFKLVLDRIDPWEVLESVIIKCGKPRSEHSVCVSAKKIFLTTVCGKLVLIFDITMCESTWIFIGYFWNICYFIWSKQVKTDNRWISDGN